MPLMSPFSTVLLVGALSIALAGAPLAAVIVLLVLSMAIEALMAAPL